MLRARKHVKFLSVASRQQTLHAICSVRHLQRLHLTTPLVHSSLVQSESSISVLGKRFELPSLRSGAWCLAKFADISIRRDVFYLKRETKGRDEIQLHTPCMFVRPFTLSSILSLTQVHAVFHSILRPTFHPILHLILPTALLSNSFP